MSDEKTTLNRLEAAQTKLEKLQRKLNRGTTVTLVVAALLLLLVAGYFIYGYREISVLVEPKYLVALGAVMVDDQVSQVRRTLQGEVKKNAPVWAEQLSLQVVDAIPTMRLELENYVLGQTEGVVNQLTGVTEAEFRKFLQDDDETMQVVLKELSSEEDVSDQTLATLEIALDEAIQGNMQEQANLLLGTLIELRGKIEKLARGRGLNDEEVLERNALMVIRRLQLEQGGESILNTLPAELLAEPETSPSTSAVQPASAVGPEKKDAVPEPSAEEKSDPKPPTEAKSDPEPPPPAKSDPEPAKSDPEPAKSDPEPAKEEKPESKSESEEEKGKKDAESE